MVLRSLCILVCLLACLPGTGCSSPSKRSQSMKRVLAPKMDENADEDTEAEVGRMARGNRKKEKEPTDIFDNFRDPRVFEIERNLGYTH